MKLARYKQIGNTCGFYSILMAYQEFYNIDNFVKKYMDIVSKYKKENHIYQTHVGEVFDIEYLYKIAKEVYTNLNNDYELNITPSLTIIHKDIIINHLNKGDKIVFPIMLSTPHYITLIKVDQNTLNITYIDGGVIKTTSIDKLIMMNEKINISNYNWKTYPKDGIIRYYLCKCIAKILFHFSKEEMKAYKENAIFCRNNIDTIQHLSETPINMRGSCIIIQNNI